MFFSAMSVLRSSGMSWMQRKLQLVAAHKAEFELELVDSWKHVDNVYISETETINYDSSP